MSILSVDLGTSNTVAVLSAHGRLRLVEVDGFPVLPSAVFAAEDGRLVVGREAERRARLDPARFEPNPKRRVDEGTLLLGDRVVPVSEAFAAVLGTVAAEVSRQLGGARPDEVRLTHPAQWGPVRRNVLLSAARHAGLGSRLVLVPEPVAAAAHFASFPGRSLAAGQGLAVYDLGAGTCDVAVVSGSVVLAEAGLPDLGGLDVDQALLAHVGRQVSGRDPGAWQRLLRPESSRDRRAQRALREDVRAAKESLTGHSHTDVALPDPFDDVLVTRAELEALIRPVLSRSVELLAATVRSAGLSRDRLAGVYLVGGSSRIPLVATLIAEQLGVVPTNLDQPETAVALGAHHVSPEEISMRTEDLPDVPAPASEPAAGIAPPRPADPAPPPAEADGGARLATRALWAILGTVVLIGALIASYALMSSGEGEKNTGPTDENNAPTVKNVVTVPNSVACQLVIPITEVRSISSNEAELQHKDEGGPLCSWFAAANVDQPDSDSFSADLYKNQWVPEYGQGTQTEEFMIKGNSAYKSEHADGCLVTVAVGQDTVLSVDVDAHDACTKAQTLLEIAFDNLRDA